MYLQTCIVGLLLTQKLPLLAAGTGGKRQEQNIWPKVVGGERQQEANFGPITGLVIMPYLYSFVTIALTCKQTMIIKL